MSHSVRTIAINLAVLCGLALLVEVGIRVWYFSRTCAKSACDYRVFTLVNFHDVSQENSSIDHERLGHLPHPGRYAVNEKGWSGQIVVIEEDSTRSNGQPAPTRTGPRLLAVGDSFTFGAQVADAETWPAALERILSAPVVNAGVNGYGFAQAALRGRLLLAEHAYDLVILSAYAPDDFLRDRLLTRYSSRKPAWVERDGTVTVSYPGDHEALRQDLMAREVQLPHFTGYSYLLKKINKDLFGYLGGHFIDHPQAAAADRIICHVTTELRRENVPAVILVQYDITTLEGEKPALVQTLAACAAENSIPVIDSWDFLSGQPDRKSLFFGHMTPEGNERLAQFIAGELKTRFPDKF